MKGSKLERKDYKFGRKHSNIGRNDSKSEKKISEGFKLSDL